MLNEKNSVGELSNKLNDTQLDLIAAGQPQRPIDIDGHGGSNGGIVVIGITGHFPL
jgi:hypothetical protein